MMNFMTFDVWLFAKHHLSIEGYNELDEYKQNYLSGEYLRDKLTYKGSKEE